MRIISVCALKLEGYFIFDFVLFSFLTISLLIPRFPVLESLISSQSSVV